MESKVSAQSFRRLQASTVSFNAVACGLSRAKQWQLAQEAALIRLDWDVFSRRLSEYLEVI